MIQQVVAEGVKPNRYVEVTQVTDAELVKLLASDSSVQRLEASRRIIDGKKKDLAPAVLALAQDESQHLYHRVAAVFTYKQVLGKESTPGLVGLVKSAAVREFALRALADRLSELEGVPTQPFVDALTRGNWPMAPRIQIVPAIGKYATR